MSEHHPGWAILHTLAVTCGFAFCLWVTASSFDATELQALAGGGIATAAITALSRKFLG